MRTQLVIWKSTAFIDKSQRQERMSALRRGTLFYETVLSSFRDISGFGIFCVYVISRNVPNATDISPVFRCLPFVNRPICPTAGDSLIG